MKIILYVDFENEEIYTEEELTAKIDKVVNSAYEGKEDCYESFSEWLDDDRFTPSEIFSLTAKQKEEIIASYKKDVQYDVFSALDLKKFEKEI